MTSNYMDEYHKLIKRQRLLIGFLMSAVNSSNADLVFLIRQELKTIDESFIIEEKKIKDSGLEIVLPDPVILNDEERTKLYSEYTKQKQALDISN